MKNKCNYICRKSEIKYLKRNTEKGTSPSKQFWNFVESFLANKGCMINDFIFIMNGDALIDKESVLVEMFNAHYINIVEKKLVFHQETILTVTNDTQEIIEETISTHPSTLLLIFPNLKLQILMHFLNKKTLKSNCT